MVTFVVLIYLPHSEGRIHPHDHHGYARAGYTGRRIADKLTFDAAVVDLQVSLEVVVARLGVAEVLVEDSHRTLATSRTLRVDQIQDVRRAADETEVLLDALADVHASIEGAPHHQHLVDTGALGAKILRLAHRLLCAAKKPHWLNNNSIDTI